MPVVVVGQIGRDLILRCGGLPASGGSTEIIERRELLGGKGANQAVALAQLGVPTALIGVVGDDTEGASVLRQAFRDGIDIGGVVRRGSTALLVDLVDGPASRRLFEDVPRSALVTVDDLDQSGLVIDAADTVSLQLQQPAATVLEAARRARMRGVRVVADGRPDPDVADELLCTVQVLRMDAAETELFAGEPVATVEAATAVAYRLLQYGPELVALAISDVGDLLVWPSGSHLFPLS
ncbi:MAG: PfkB family carbohydrate kinase, partial [Actinomycetota bacterium]|nr:PfkB family carbohydrate kinase [Actinomycetota bacterium]